jgi:aminocarboxymuconate-semialdehyde decarboxylase
LIIDVHTHTMPSSVKDALERDPERFDSSFEDVDGTPWLVMQGRRRGPVTPGCFDIEYRLANMDKAGIDVQVLSPRPFLLSYWLDVGWAAELASQMNEGMAGMTRESDRFWALGQLPLQSAERSLAELERLQALGLVGIEIGANIDGIELDDESLEPVWARLSELELPVFVHPINTGYLPRLEPYHLTNIIGNPLDTTIALSRLILGGVLIRHPGIRFYFAHGGGYIPYLYGRIDHAYEARSDTSSAIDVLPSSLLERCYFDTITHARSSLRYLIDSMGDERVVVGTDYPADMADTEIARTLSELDLSEAARERIEHENAERLFGHSAAAA